MSKFFIERPILANVIAIVTILLGAVCLYTLPVAQYPEIVPPTIQVSTNYAGASAEVVAAPSAFLSNRRSMASKTRSICNRPAAATAAIRSRSPLRSAPI